MEKKVVKSALAAGVVLLLSLCLLIGAYVIYTKMKSGDITLGESKLPMKAGFGMHQFFSLHGSTYGMAIGEEAKLRLSLSSEWEGANTTALLSIPSGLEVLEGQRTWAGNIGRNETVLEVMVRAVKVGVWNVTANVTSFKGGAINTADPAISLCVMVTREELKEKCG